MRLSRNGRDDLTTCVARARVAVEPRRASGFPADEFVCWSRMQAEAGQTLEDIVARKDLERRAGAGSFFWGVGTPPALAIDVLARAHVPVRVVFSVMKSPPKAADAKPARVVAWRCYVDVRGVQRPIPDHALVTSRGDTAGGPKRSHYALMCHSEVELTLRRGEPFDPSGFRNASGAAGVVGASQVTALLRRDGPGTGTTGYDANMTAWLSDSYWVRLVDPVELDGPRLATLRDAASCGVAGWCEAVSRIRGSSASAQTAPSDGLLF